MTLPLKKKAPTGKRKRRKRGDKDYVNNKEFTAAVIECLKDDDLNDYVVDCFIKIANRAVLRLYFKDPLDKEDCIAAALCDMVKYWRNFNPEKSTNAFAYFTQIATHGYGKEFKKIHKEVGKDYDAPMSLDQMGESTIYTI